MSYLSLNRSEPYPSSNYGNTGDPDQTMDALGTPPYPADESANNLHHMTSRDYHVTN